MIMAMISNKKLGNLVSDIVWGRPVELAHIVDGLSSSVETRVYQGVRWVLLQGFWSRTQFQIVQIFSSTWKAELVYVGKIAQETSSPGAGYPEYSWL